MSLDMKTLSSSHWCGSGVFIVDFSLSTIDFEQVITSREYISSICICDICVFYNKNNCILISNYNIYFNYESNPV